MTKWMNKPISELHDALVRKTVTPLQLVQDCIDGVKADKGNCFEATAFDQALAEAAKIDDVKPEEYLKGIPFLAKDNFSTKGVETTASSDILNGYVPLFDATAISRLKRAGMIMVAKTTMDELAMGGTGTTGHKGNTPNPYDPERIVGGSSCGSAASLAYGIAPLALGSDTGDSVRKPASYSATVGFKATWGRISRFGLFPFATSMDAVGFFTRNVLDAGYVLSALSVFIRLCGLLRIGRAIALINRLRADFGGQGLTISSMDGPSQRRQGQKQAERSGKKELFECFHIT